ncbi:MAG: DNA mismatch repair protein MutL [Saprospiraceae bacterium]|jgi:DNA mismatch repair protein MutL
MSNSVIKLLPENVANQIAAGEVIQRPASVLKELMENAVDSGATNIQVVVKDAGKSLIQIIDNGCGMNPEDAKLCFQRHATSKIKHADDLFALKSKGFRGEALASIASIAHVELKTKTENGEIGQLIKIEGGIISDELPCNQATGTSFSVKNLFFNVPARRKFLKSNNVEGRHINDEFTRIALTHPEIKFTLHINDQLVYNLGVGKFNQRIMSIFGKSYKEKLVPIEEETDFIHLSGFIIKPEFSKKTRGEQFFFANNRFIKHNYFHHAIKQAFEDLIPHSSHPSYFIHLKVDPKDIDVNIHPTKTEIKFSDERSIYAIIKTVVQRSLNRHSLAPTLDFERETSFDTPAVNWDKPLKNPEIKVNKNYNPFDTGNDSSNNWSKGGSFKVERTERNSSWEKLYKDNQGENDQVEDSGLIQEEITLESDPTQEKIFQGETTNVGFYKQFKSKYLLTENENGILIINQKRAHERVLFEHFINLFDEQQAGSQRLLFPETIEVPAKDMSTIEALLPDLVSLGFDISLFGKDSFVVNGVPSDMKNYSAKDLVEDLIAQFQQDTNKLKLSQREKLAVSMAKKLAVKYGQKMESEEVKTLCEQLFMCEQPLTSPTGKPTLISYNLSLIDKQLG